MLTATDTRVDEKETLRTLETFIDKRREAARLREVKDDHYRRVSALDTEVRSSAQEVEQLEGRLKIWRRDVLLGKVKSAELSTLKQQVAEAKAMQSRRLLDLDAQREGFCLVQDAWSQLMADLNQVQSQLRDGLSQLFIQRFYEEDTGLYGKRGQVSWMDPSPLSPERWRR